MAAAARLTDPIGHSPTMNWLVTGLLVGAAVGIAGAAIFATGGLAAAAIIGGAAATGGGLMEFASTFSGVDKEVVGAIDAIGASNVFANGLAAARAHLDSAACSKHPEKAIIATGSGTVFINSMPAARVDDKTICSAVITAGASNVYIGGPTVQTDEIHPENLVPTWVHVAMGVVGIGSALVLAAPAVVAGGLVLGVAGGFGGNWVGGKVFGEGSDGQKLSALGGSILGGFLGAKTPSLLPSARPAAGPVNFMEGKDRFYLNASNRADVDPNGFFDVVAHGTPNKIQVQTPNGPVLVDSRVAARLIQQSPGYNGQNIRLLSCSTGSCNKGMAQNLANKLGVEVHAPTDLLWAYPNGRMIVAPRNAKGGPDLTKIGGFREFEPGKPK